MCLICFFPFSPTGFDAGFVCKHSFNIRFEPSVAVQWIRKTKHVKVRILAWKCRSLFYQDKTDSVFCMCRLSQRERCNWFRFCYAACILWLIVRILVFGTVFMPLLFFKHFPFKWRVERGNWSGDNFGRNSFVSLSNKAQSEYEPTKPINVTQWSSLLLSSLTWTCSLCSQTENNFVQIDSPFPILNKRMTCDSLQQSFTLFIIKCVCLQVLIDRILVLSQKIWLARSYFHFQIKTSLRVPAVESIIFYLIDWVLYSFIHSMIYSVNFTLTLKKYVYTVY